MIGNYITSMSNIMTNEPPENIDRTLRHALDMLDCYGAPGALAICLLEDGGTLLRASGVCQDPHGLLLGLQAIAESIQQTLRKAPNKDYQAACSEVIGAVSKALDILTRPVAH